MVTKAIFFPRIRADNNEGVPSTGRKYIFNVAIVCYEKSGTRAVSVIANIIM